MKVIRAEIPDVLIIEPRVFGDDWGFFLKATTRNSYQKSAYL
jgi:dTDP-4-dehydrorhamnose 3,5-epimerase-like enzyme